MADEVVNVIHRFVYEMDASGVEATTAKFINQMKVIDDEETKLNELKAQLASLSASGGDIDDLTQKIKQQELAIENETNALRTLVQTDEKFQNQIRKEIGLYNSLIAQQNKVGESSKRTATGMNAMHRASFDLSQILREMPAFAYSAQVGLLAISNNIPIFLDSFKAANQEVGGFVPTLKKLGESLFSMTNLITIATGLLVIFGREIFKSSKEVDEATKANNDYYKSLQDIQNAAIKAYTSETNNAKVLVDVLMKVILIIPPMNQRLVAAKRLKDMFPGYFKDIKAEQILTDNLAASLTDLNTKLEFKQRYEGNVDAANKAQEGLNISLKLYDKETDAIAKAQTEYAEYQTQIGRNEAKADEMQRNIENRIKAHEKERDRIANLTKQRDEDLAAATKAFAVAAPLYDKEEKQKQKRQKEDRDYTERILKEIAALNEEYAKNDLKKKDLTYEQRAKLIQQASSSDLEKEIAALNIERAEVAKNTKTSASELQALDDKEAAIKRNNAQKLYQDLSALRDDYFEKDKEKSIKRLQDQIGIDKQALKLLQESGKDDLDERKRIVDEETKSNQLARIKRYKILTDEAKRLGQDSVDIERRSSEEEVNIINEGNRKKLQADEDYYKKQYDLIEENKEFTINAIRANANVLTNVRLQAASLEIEARKKEQKQANQLLDRTVDNPAASEEDIAKAQNAFNVARTNLKQAKIEYAATVADMVSEAMSAFNDLAKGVGGIMNGIYQQQIALLDAEIQYRESNMTYAVELARRGNTSILEEEQKRLEESSKAREAAARKQVQMNALLQASESATAATAAISGVLKAASGAAANPITFIASLIAGVIAVGATIIALRQAFTANETPSFAGGGYTGDGGQYQSAGTVHKGEYVSHQKATRMYRPYLEMMNKGTFPIISMDYVSKAQEKNDKKMLGKMDEMIDAVKDNQVQVHNRMDDQGWYSMTERMKRKERRKWQ